MCRTGACSHLLASISGFFSDATPGLGCAGAGLMVDSSIPPDFRCPDGGFMAACSASGPPGSLHFTGTMPTHAIDEQVRLVSVQINPQGFPQPTLSQPQFGLLDSDLSVHNAGRIAEAGTFPVPIPNGTTIQVGAVIEILPLVPGQTGPLLPPIEVHPGDPMLGDSYFFINPHSRLSGPGIPPALNSFFDVFQTVSLDGLDTSLRHHRFTITTSSIIVTPISATQYSVNFSGSFPINPGTPLPVTRVNLNFDSVGNAYGAPPTVHCPVVEALAQSVAADYNTGPITLSVAAHGEEPMTFQWSKNAVILAESPSPHSVAGTRSSSLIINPTRSTDAGLYTCLVTNTCGSATSPPITLTIRCHADFNGVGGLTVADIFDFLAAWFSGDPRADFNGDGVISVTDIFDFLAAWFAGCTP